MKQIYDTPIPMTTEEGMKLLKEGFALIRDELSLQEKELFEKEVKEIFPYVVLRRCTVNDDYIMPDTNKLFTFWKMARGI